MFDGRKEQLDEARGRNLDDASLHRGQAMRDSMWKGHGGFELAFTPVFFGAIGWLLDGRFGISPILTIVFAVVGLLGSVVNQYSRYSAAMEQATSARLAARPNTSAPASLPAKPFGRVEVEEVDMSIDFTEPRNSRVAS